MAPRASALPSIALPPVLDPARDAATVREMLRPKAKRLRDMTPRERRRVRPRPPSELAAQAAVARYLRRFRAALQRQLIDNLSIILSIHQDALDPHQYAVRFANLEVSVGELESDLGRDLRQTVVGLEEHTRGELQRVMRVSLEDIGLQAQADEYVRDSVNLIRSVSFEQLGKMRQIVASAAGGQLSQRDLAKQILERFDVTKSRARLIARDQVLKFNARASEALQRGAGVEGYFWSTSKDIRVRGLPGGKNPHGHHHQLEGTRQSWNEPPVVDLRTGRREHPGKDYQCRCVAIPDTEDLLYGGLEDEVGSSPSPVRAPLPEPARGAAPLPAALPTTAFTVAPKALEKLAELNAAEDTTAASYVRYRLEYLPIKDIDVPDAWSQAKLDNIVGQLRAGKDQWPIRAEMGDDGKYVIEDGIHRANASRALGLTHVPAIVGEIVRR